MPRSSRHKSHKQKHSSRDLKEYSDSEEEAVSAERRRREDSGISVSESGEKRDLQSQPQQDKDLAPDYTSSKRRRDRADSAVTDRWNGGEERRGVEGLGSDKAARGEGYGSDSEKRAKMKAAIADSKGRSSRRPESSGDRKDEILDESEEAKKGSGRIDSKRKLDRDSGSRDAECRDVKEKDRGLDRDRKVQDGRPESSVDILTVGSGETSRKQGMRMSGSEEERNLKREVEITECHILDDLRNTELEKELEKRIRRRDGSGDKDKRQEDSRDGEDRRLSSRDDRQKNGRCKDERHKDAKYREKYREEVDRDHRFHDEKHKAERSRDRAIDRSDASSESRHKKAKLQGSDSDGSPHLDDRNKEDRGRKKSSVDFDDQSNLNARNTKELRIDVEGSAFSSGKSDSLAERGRSESHHRHLDVADHPSPNNNELKRSPRSGSNVVKDQHRHGSKLGKSRDSFSEEKNWPNATYTKEGDGAFGGVDRTFESPMDKQKQMDDSDLIELLAENVTGSQYGRSSKSVHTSSPILIAEKSPSSTSGDKKLPSQAVVRRSLEVEETGRKSSGSKDGRDYSSSKSKGWELLADHSADDLYQSEIDCEAAPVGSTSRLPSRSPSLPPPPPFRHGVDSPSVIGSSEEDSRASADRKSNNRFKTSGELNVGRGQGNTFNGVPNWPSPVTNGFVHFQHGPPGGYHPVMQQFPATPLFGVRPSIELTHPGLSYPMHDADRFSGHARPFRWRMQSEDSCHTQLHGWDGGSSVFGDESHIYGRPDWDQKRQFMSNRGWEMNVDMWKGQNGNSMSELPAPKSESHYSTQVPQDEHRPGHLGHGHQSDKSQPENNSSVKNEVKQFDVSPAKVSPEIIPEKVPKGSKTSSNDSPDLCRKYLSMLDISADLASPDVYKQYASLLAKDSVTTSMTTQSDYEDGIQVAKSKRSNYILRDCLFPAASEALYQRAMDLYKKQKTEINRNISISSSSDGSKLDKVSSASGEEVKSVEDQVKPVEDRSSPDHAMPMSPSAATPKVICSVENEENTNGGAKECQSNPVSGPIVLADDSQAFEALMPESVECSVNLSRIHNPPEDTH